MIESLSISNYALIDSIEIDFAKGLNIITGETGAGKSIMLGAMSMLFGNRADTKVVRNKEKKSIVEAVFNVSEYQSLKSLAESNDIDWNGDQLILRREIAPNGRSRSFINDTPVQLALLKEFAVKLVDIHSQHQNLLLSSPEYQLHIVDTLLPDDAIFNEYRQAYEAYRTALRKYNSIKRALESSRAEEEYLRFRLAKLDELNPQPGEQQELENERKLLADVTGIKAALSRVVYLLTDSEESADNLLRSALNEAQTVDSVPSLEDMPARLDSLRIEVSDIAASFESMNSTLEANPARLEMVEERLSDIYEMQHKFGVETVEELIVKRDELRAKIDTIDNGDEQLKLALKHARQAKAAALDVATRLSVMRREVAQDVAARLVESCIPLGMKNISAEFKFETVDLTPTGIDDVTLMVAFNKNQPLMPVKDTASGGEISRLMLSVKAIVAKKMALPSIIFDEIDTGVSGDVANRMGQLMKEISEGIQVVSITHLPQIAAKGDIHFKVYKEDDETSTNTHVRRLSASERVDEIALMLSGDPTLASARLAATSLLSAR